MNLKSSVMLTDRSKRENPPCFGVYQPECEYRSDCPAALRIACAVTGVRAALAEHMRRTDRPRKLGPVGYHLRRLGYPERICREADADWRSAR